MAQDYYAELGLGRGASQADIKKAYRKLAAELHPDRNPDKPHIEERFKRVNSAYHALSDEKKKKLYDQFGEAGLREGFDPNMGNPFGRGGGGGFEDIFGGAAAGGGIGDLFGDLFGGGRGGGRRRARTSPDMESEITIEFTSAIKGAELELQVHGRAVKVRIPRGADNGDKVRVKGAASGHPGIPPGDLLLVLKVKPHPHFEREGLDLTLPLPITVLEALSGAKVDVPTITGSVSLKVPAHTQSGQLLRLRGKGITRGKNTGDLYVRFQIQIPKTNDGRLEDAARLLAEATDEHLRDDLAF